MRIANAFETFLQVAGVSARDNHNGNARGGKPNYYLWKTLGCRMLQRALNNCGHQRVMERFAFSANILRIPDHIEEGRVAGTASSQDPQCITVYYSYLNISKPLSKPLPNWAVVIVVIPPGCVLRLRYNMTSGDFRSKALATTEGPATSLSRRPDGDEARWHRMA